MEILGLAIVVVLILVAATFVVRFLLLKQPADYRKGFVSKQLSSNTISALLKTTTECSNLDMTELLRDCAQSRSITCDNGKDSCGFAEGTAKYIFSKTLDTWGRSYEFKAYTNDPTQPILKLGNPCKGDIEPSLFLVPILNSGNIYVKLDICN